MNKKIPENVKFVLEDVNSNILWNYITNLQIDIEQSQEIMAELTEENKRLNKTLEEHDEILENTFNLVEQLILRIDKEIEYI